MTNLQMQRGMQAAGEGADTAGASLKQSTAATGQRSPAALALALAFPAALEKYAKNHFHKHLGIKRTLKKPRTQHHPLPPAPCSSPLPSRLPIKNICLRSAAVLLLFPDEGDNKSEKSVKFVDSANCTG